MPQTNPAYVPHQLTLQVLSDGGGRLEGLYVLYRPARPESETASFFDWSLWDDDEEEAPDVAWERGYCGRGAFLEPPPDFVGPIASGCKLGEGVAYEMYFIRHPDPAYSSAAQSELNGLQPAYYTRDWPAPQVLTPAVEVVDMGDGEIYEQLTLKLPSTPETYQPRGGERYGGWVLYKDMPHAFHADVKTAVEQAQRDLGKLRYPIGGQDRPYEPEDEQDMGGVPNVGVFDARVMNGVLQLQRDTLAGKVRRVRDKGSAHDRATGSGAAAASWEYLDAEDAVVTKPTPRPPERDFVADGVLDSITARAIEQWLDAGYRRPGLLLVAVNADTVSKTWTLWLREDAARSLVAWRKLVQALGFAHGIFAGHCYRSPLKNVLKAKYGTSAISNHKSGLAIDVRMGNYQPLYEPMAGKGAPWPVWYVQVDRDETSGKNRRGVRWTGYKAHWRVYAASTLDADPTRAVADARAALVDVAEKGTATERTYAQTIIGELDAGNFSKYFVDRITPWEYDDYHEDGGVPGAEIEPPVPGTRFLDLTEVASVCHLMPIRSFSNVDGATESDWGAVRAWITPNSIARVKLLGSNLATAQAERRETFLVPLDGREVPLAEIDAAFVSAYGQTMNDIVNDRSLRGAWSITGSQLTIKLGSSESRRKAIEAIAGKLEGMGAVRLAGVGDGAVKTCNEWAQHLRDQLALLTSPAERDDGSSSSTPSPPAEIVLVPIVAEADGAPIRLLPQEPVMYPTPGTPTGLEWWHFQRTDLVSGSTFGDLLRSLGWSTEGLLNTPSAVTHGRTGLGYPATQLSKPAS